MGERIRVANELRTVLGRHESRYNYTLSIGVKVAESLQTVFDEYVRVEIDDLRSQIQLLQQASRDLQKEESKLNELEKRFEEVSSRLNLMLDAARANKIKSFRKVEEITLEERRQPVEELEIDLLVEGFIILGELEELRSDVERWSRTYIRDIDDMISVFDEMLDQRGL